MDPKTVQLFFPLLRSAITGVLLTEEERAAFDERLLPELFSLAKKHDITNILAVGLQKNELAGAYAEKIDQEIFKAVYRHSQLQYEYERLCATLEKEAVDFLPLKGSVLRAYYPEPWMRTSCDIDVLVRRADLEDTVKRLVAAGYEESERTRHDVSLFSAQGIHIELHFDLVEEGRANRANDVLTTVWEHASRKQGFLHWQEVSDAFFYFYHIAHMAKHFETGGCGVRPFLDLWILDRMEGIDREAREALLKEGELHRFLCVVRDLARAWMGEGEMNELLLQMQSLLLFGGVYGSTANRVALQQSKNGGRVGYVFSRLFLPYAKLKTYYPILEKHRWLMPVMQVRRWFMLLRPSVARMAKNELAANQRTDRAEAEQMGRFLKDIGLN